MRDEGCGMRGASPAGPRRRGRTQGPRRGSLPAWRCRAAAGDGHLGIGASAGRDCPFSLPLSLGAWGEPQGTGQVERVPLFPKQPWRGRWETKPALRQQGRGVEEARGGREGAGSPVPAV